ncbi:MAG: DUF4902 domain-containing protein [Bacteroidota bacterium]
MITLDRPGNGNQDRHDTQGIARMPMITLSPDGYVRLQPEYFVRVKLTHLHSRVDGDRPPVLTEGATPSPITGYTEWISETRPAITIGWDWQMTARDGQIQLIPLDYPRSNLMLIDEHGNDLGYSATEALLRSWVKSFEWQPSMHKALHP